MNAGRVIDVKDLGQRGLIVNASMRTLVLLDTGLDHDERIEILEGLMDREGSEPE